MTLVRKGEVKQGTLQVACYIASLLQAFVHVLFSKARLFSVVEAKPFLPIPATTGDLFPMKIVFPDQTVDACVF